MCSLPTTDARKFKRHTRLLWALFSRRCSFRVGAALDLLKRGVPLEKIMLRGGWKSETTALRYLRSWVGEEVEWLV